MRVETATEEVINLEEFKQRLDRELDIESEESMRAMSPHLVALCNNKRFLAEFLTSTLLDDDFQSNNPWDVGATLMLGRGHGYVIRAVLWPPQSTDDLSASDGGKHVYHGDAGVVHSHPFSLLTAGYWGPGYETVVYSFDQNVLNPRNNVAGCSAGLRPTGRFRLSPGTALFYPAYTVAHIQYPPADYSISVNLIIRTKGNLRDQLYFDLKTDTVLRAGDSANDNRIELIRMASALSDRRLMPALEVIASNHVSFRVREEAAAALEEQRKMLVGCPGAESAAAVE